jgi:hypothetical protein
VGESTVYNHVAGRDELCAVAAATVFDRLDIDAEADWWAGYVDAVAQRTFDLARRHPGLRDYVLHGPYEPSTVATFEALIDRVRVWLPDVAEHLAFVVVSRPDRAGSRLPGRSGARTGRPGCAGRCCGASTRRSPRGPLPPVPRRSWRFKLRPVDWRPRAPGLPWSGPPGRVDDAQDLVGDQLRLDERHVVA